MKKEREVLYMRYNINISAYAKPATKNEHVKQHIAREISKDISSTFFEMSYDLPRKIAKGLKK